MGIGIWSMHYVGMLAFRLPVPVQYDWPTALVSLLAAVFASAVAIVIAFVALLLTFHFRDSTTSGGWQKALSAVVMGAAIPVMHYRKNTDAVAEWFCYWGFWGQRQRRLAKDVAPAGGRAQVGVAEPDCVIEGLACVCAFLHSFAVMTAVSCERRTVCCVSSWRS